MIIGQCHSAQIIPVTADARIVEWLNTISKAEEMIATRMR